MHNQNKSFPPFYTAAADITNLERHSDGNDMTFYITDKNSEQQNAFI